MGYSADRMESAGDIVITPDRHEALLEGLRAVEAKEGIGHISWCDRLDSYVGSTSEIVARIISDYGFEVTTVTEEDVVNAVTVHPDDMPAGTIVIDGWGGEKLGSCWDLMWKALAPVALRPTHWVMHGEDGDMWADVITDEGKHTTRGVTVSVDW